MGQACINSGATCRWKDKTVNYAAISTTLIDTGSIESSDVSKFYSNLILVKAFEYCHDQKSQSVNSLAPIVADPVRSPEHHGALPGGTGRWPGVTQQPHSFGVRVLQVSVAPREVCLAERPALRAGI